VRSQTRTCTPSHHCVLCSQCTDSIAQATTHSPPEASLHQATPQRRTRHSHHSHPPITHSHNVHEHRSRTDAGGVRWWEHPGRVMAIMPRSVRARAHALLTSPLHNMRSYHHCTTCSLITLAQHALTSPFAQHALTSPLHDMRSRVGRRREGLPLPAVSRGDPVG
jgi:hypothetical protein